MGSEDVRDPKKISSKGYLGLLARSIVGLSNKPNLEAFSSLIDGGSMVENMINSLVPSYKEVLKMDPMEVFNGGVPKPIMEVCSQLEGDI